MSTSRRRIFSEYRVAAALAWGALAWMLPTRAVAHGGPPRALAPLTTDAQGPKLVHLSAGLARRTDAGFRYLCPALWAGDESSPAGALPGGPGVVASSSPSSLYLIEDDGAAAPHASGDLGRVVGFASSSTALFALFARGDRYEVHRVARDRTELLWSDGELWEALSAGESTLQLVALRAGELWQVILAHSGQELARAHAAVSAAVFAIEPRTMGDVPYVTLSSDSGAGLSLGRLSAEGWRELAHATSTLAGPIARADGLPLLALDGALASFANEQVAPLDASEFVTELGRVGAQSFASVRSGLRAVDSTGFGARLFSWDALAAPELELVPAAQRSGCNDQWQHARFDLIAAGLLEPSRADAGASSDGAVAGGPTTTGDRGSEADAGERQRADEDAPGARVEAGCTVGCATYPGAGSAPWLALVLAAAALARRRARSHRSRHTVVQVLRARP